MLIKKIVIDDAFRKLTEALHTATTAATAYLDGYLVKAL